MTLRRDTKIMAGWLIVILPTVVYGGFSILSMVINKDVGIVENALRKDFFRAGHAHAGVLLMLSLIAYLYVDKAELSTLFRSIVKSFIPLSAIFVPGAFFFSMISKTATEPNGWIYLSYVGIFFLVVGLIILGIGLIRSRSDST